MSRSQLPSRASARPDAARYRVRVLERAEPTPDGVAHGPDGGRGVLAWNRVRHALAAEVGEPEGVRTVVFDLVVGVDDGGCEVWRFDADPCDGAREVARAIADAIGSDRAAASIKSVATDGTVTRSYPDLEALAEGALEEIRGLGR